MSLLYLYRGFIFKGNQQQQLVEASSRAVRALHERERRHNAPLRRHKYVTGARAVQGGWEGSIDSAPWQGGQKTEPRRFEVLGEVAGARLSVREDT